MKKEKVLVEISYDEEAGAVYIKLLNREVKETVSKTVLLDLDKDGKIIGIEILDVKKVRVIPSELTFL